MAQGELPSLNFLVAILAVAVSGWHAVACCGERAITRGRSEQG
jgi:hypothetical protein